MKTNIALLIALLLAPLAGLHAADVTTLRCEYRENPLGIDVEKPRLSWIIEERSQNSGVRSQDIGARGLSQTAYQILVASSEELLAKDQGDLWDSGKVASDQSIQVEYAGKHLESRMHCYWKVRVWITSSRFGVLSSSFQTNNQEPETKNQKTSAWSKPALWTMGLLTPEDWTAKWIKPDVAMPGKNGFDNCAWIWFPSSNSITHIPPGTEYFRARLSLPEGVGIKRAFVAMTADNAFTLFVNGQDALKGDDWQKPQGVEIAKLLKAGENLIAVAASNASWSPSGLIGRVTVELEDGRTVTLDTGNSWKVSDSEQAGWQESGFADAAWSTAREMAKFGDQPWGRPNLKQATAPWMPPVQENWPEPWVRKVFTLATAPDRATAYVNVMGYYELYVNGQKVGDEVLAPAISDLTRRSFYQTYDIGKLLRPGRNCVGLWLGPGWRRGAGAAARVQIETSAGGTPVVVGTDNTWTCAPSTHSVLEKWRYAHFGGEYVDSRSEMAGWNQVECTAREWIPVKEIPALAGEVLAQTCPPNRIGKTIPLVACTALGTNTWELDFGANLTGWLRLRLPQMECGQRVVMHYADKRGQTPKGDDTPAGFIRSGPTNDTKTFETSAGPVCYHTFSQRDEFISAGKSGEPFCSKFNYHGFRYVVVEGLPVKPAPGAAEALLVESDLEPAGTFECSNDLFNRINEANLWTLRCLDLGGYMVDCPTRERGGYGDGQVGIEALVMSRNAATLYGKWAGDWFDAQNPSTGEIAHTAPSMGGAGGPGWGGAGCVLPWKLYLYYGDRRLLERGYELARRYVEWLETKCANGVLRFFGSGNEFIGDWVAPGRGMDSFNMPKKLEKPTAELFNNGYLLYLMDQLARTADILGRKDEAQAWRTKINERRPLIHAAFYDELKQCYVLDEEAYQVMPLMTGVVPESLRGSVSRKLEEIIRVKNQGHLDTGMLGTYFLIQYLQETGRNDLLYTIFNQTTYPGWGYMLSQGATTFWEQWNGYASQIHSCFTSPGGWFYQGLAGIRPDPAAPGFKKIIIKPTIVGDLTWVKCHYDSIHGRIVSNWKRKGSKLTMDVTIPANTTATVFVPAKDAAGVTESGLPSAQAKGLKFLRMENNTAIYAVGSGTYQFQSTLSEIAGQNTKGESK